MPENALKNKAKRGGAVIRKDKNGRALANISIKNAHKKTAPALPTRGRQTGPEADQ